MRRERADLPGIGPPLALATDLDGTLTLGGKPLDGHLAGSLLRVKGMGTKLILVTGRCTGEAREIVGPDLFDAIVAENGAVLAVGSSRQEMAPPGWGKVRERLLPHVGEGCEEVILSAGIEKLQSISSFLPPEARIEVNKDRLMVLPPGVDKGRGLLEVLSMLGIPPERTACLGDGENDVSMFEAVGIRVALGNSTEELKRKADFVSLKGDGEGALEAMERLFPNSFPGPRRAEMPQ